MLHLYYTSMKVTEKENRKTDSFMEAKFNCIIFLYSYLSVYRIKSPFGCLFLWLYKLTRTCKPEQDTETKHRAPSLLLHFTEEINWDPDRRRGCRLKFHNKLVTEPGLELRSQTHPTHLLDNHVQEVAGYEWVASPTWPRRKVLGLRPGRQGNSWRSIRKVRTLTICGSFTGFK